MPAQDYVCCRFLRPSTGLFHRLPVLRAQRTLALRRHDVAAYVATIYADALDAGTGVVATYGVTPLSGVAVTLMIFEMIFRPQRTYAAYSEAGKSGAQCGLRQRVTSAQRR